LSILAVEDHPGVAELILHLLNDVDGWGATVAHDAASARSTFQQVQIDVLILACDLTRSNASPPTKVGGFCD
jgi:DNA-binding response OmpR family regulator